MAETDVDVILLPDGADWKGVKSNLVPFRTHLLIYPLSRDYGCSYEERVLFMFGVAWLRSWLYEWWCLVARDF